ncbi:hypothetical protein AURDEDRAFT_173009 [Auricularia subglabra TFB-10046 SS5]|uniref:Uncharacterized protein n=1 Tax=Auricularia subglabra (strain TFB-10046 / SS5) TaxID=717982 RepID=J0WUY0_AURST|nr:hypothetical protein AURDEDRAFT_173009 [Auricularia subglabra TFB-10046 SS5]
MAKKQRDVADDPAPAARRSSRRGAVQAEEPAPQITGQGRSGGRRVASSSADSAAVNATPAAPAAARGLGRRGTQQGDDATSLPSRTTRSSRAKADVVEESPEPEGTEEELRGEGANNEQDEQDEEQDEESLSPSKATRAAASARARAAEAVSSEEDPEMEGGGELLATDEQRTLDGDEEVGESNVARPRVPTGGALTPSPRKRNPAPPVEDGAPEDDEDAFVRPQKAHGSGSGKVKFVPQPARPAASRGERVGGLAKPLGKAPSPRGQKGSKTGDRAPENEPDEEVEEADDERPKARRQTKAVQQELASAARVSALEELGSRMVGMLGQLKNAGVRLDFASAPVTFGSAPPAAGPSAAVSPAKAYSRADNFKGDGSSREGKPSTDGRKYGAVWGSWENMEVGLNVSDYTRKNNETQRDTTELFYPIVRKAYAMNRFRESYVAVIAMPVSGDLKGMTYAWASPRLLQDLPDFLDDCVFEISHGTMDKRAHGYAKALSDYKRKALKDLAELNRKYTDGQGSSAAGGSQDVAGAERAQSGSKGKEPAVQPATPSRIAALPQTPDVGQKRKRASGDGGDEERPMRQTADARPAAGNRNKVAKVVGKPAGDPAPRRPLTPRNASMRIAAEDTMDVEK